MTHKMKAFKTTGKIRKSITVVFDLEDYNEIRKEAAKQKITMAEFIRVKVLR